MIRQAGRIICVVFLMFFGWISASQAVTGSISLDWRSLEVALYELPLSGEMLNAPEFSIDSSNVSASYNDKYDYNFNDSDADISATVVSATASATSEFLSCSLSGGGYVSVWADRWLYQTSTDAGLLMVSIDYIWEYADFDLASDDYISGLFYIDLYDSYYTYDGSDKYFSVEENFYFDSYSNSGEADNDSGKLTLWASLDSAQDYELNIGVSLDGEMAPTPTPVPGSVIMLLFGLSCLAAIRVTPNIGVFGTTPRKGAFQNAVFPR